MYTIKLTIAYDGTAYNGWQIQKSGRTIQEELEKAIERVYGKRARVHCAGRTDAGVHALGQVAHFKAPVKIPARKIPAVLNAFLPSDISVLGASYAREDFHAQFDAKGKLYQYFILNSRRRDPFRERYAVRVPYGLDVEAMKEEAKTLLGRHDFRAFQASDPSTRSPSAPLLGVNKRKRTSVRRISRIDVAKRGERIIVSAEADGFLYNMVRNIAGTLLDVGRGYLSKGSVKAILDGADRAKAGPTAPARGLFLVKVKY